MRFVWLSQVPILVLIITKWLVFVMDTRWVFCDVKFEFLVP